MEKNLIDELKNKGIKIHSLGRAYFNERIDNYSQKEKTISDFKRGFASHATSQLHYIFLNE